MVYTFYSYKGGVGRSMALANIAELFYRSGLKVLMVDWDLEAPGLEKFFPIDPEDVKDKPGVMDMLLDYKKKMSQEISIVKGEDLPFKKPAEVAIDIYPDSSSKGKLYLLTAGRRSKEHFAEYASSVLNFDWRDFYRNWEGELYFEWLRQQFESIADIVLMDSRTGVTEMGGVCVYQFADIVVMFCATNRQNLEGTYEMARNFKRSEVQDLRHGRPLEIIIVPSRVEILSEVTYLNEFQNNFIDRFKEFVPKKIGADAESFWKLKIPYVPYYAFNELLAARDQGKASSEPLITAFNLVADAMSKFDPFLSTFRNLEQPGSDIKAQNLRNFTVQIRNLKTDSPVGTGILVSSDGKIATSAHVVNEAIGSDSKRDLGLSVGVYLPQLQSNKRMAVARIIASHPDHDDDIVLVKLADDEISIDPNYVALLGTAEGSCDHSFISYGFSPIANYSPVIAKGTILREVDTAEERNLRVSHLRLEISEISPIGIGRKIQPDAKGAVNTLKGEISLDLAGAAVLDVARDLVVGIVSKMVSRDKPDRNQGTSLAVDARILSLDPFNLPIQLRLGDLYASKKRYDEAIKAYAEAIKMDPKQHQAWLGLGRLYAQSTKYDEAIDAYANAIRIEPMLESAWLEIGRIHSQREEHEKAIEAYKKTLEINPKSETAWIGLAETNVECGSYNEAIEAYANVTEINPKNALNWMNLGRVYTKKGEIEEAINAYLKSTKIDPEIADAWEELGDLYSQKGSYDEAIDVYEKATRIDAKKEPELSKKRALCLEIKERKRSDQIMRNQRRTRALAAMSIAILIIASISTFQSYQKASLLQDIVDTSLAEEMASKSDDVFDDSADSFVLSTLLAIESAKLHPTPEGDRALRRGLALLPLPINSMRHDSRVNAIAFSPNGKSLLTASDDRTAVVWNATSGQKSGLMLQKSMVKAAAYNPNGTLIATVGTDNIIRIWDSAQIGGAASREKATIKCNDSITAIAFSPKGDLFAAASNRSVTISDPIAGQELARAEHDDIVNSIAFSPNGDRLASASSDNSAWIWDISTIQRPKEEIQSEGDKDRLYTQSMEFHRTMIPSSAGSMKYTRINNIKPIGKIRELQRLGHRRDVMAVAFSPDGSLLATGSADNAAYLWETSTGRKLYEMDHEGPVNAIVFSPDGRLLATACLDKKARVWDVSTGHELASMAHNNTLSGIAFSPDGERLATASADNTARVWNVSIGYELARMVHNGDVIGMAFSPDGTLLATAGSDGLARVWDAAIDLEPKKLYHGSSIICAAFSPDGRLVATAGLDGSAKIWNAQTGGFIGKLKHEDSVLSVAFSPDGERIATASMDKTARIWDEETGQVLLKLNHEYDVNDVAFSPDGQLVATASSDNTSKIWNAMTGQEIKRLSHSDDVIGVAFSPDGGRIATASLDASVKIWSVQTGREIINLSGNGELYRVAFSPDGKLVAVSGEGVPTIWDAKTGNVRQRLYDAGGAIGIAFSPDGKLVATAGFDGTARIWNAQTGQEIHRFNHDQTVRGVAFSPDGLHIASAGENGMAYIWLLNTEDAINEACRRLTRDISTEEWSMYMRDRSYQKCCPEI